MTDNTCRLNYGTLKAINYKKNLFSKYQKNCSELKEKETVIVQYKDIFFFLQGAKLVFHFSKAAKLQIYVS